MKITTQSTPARYESRVRIAASRLIARTDSQELRNYLIRLRKCMAPAYAMGYDGDSNPIADGTIFNAMVRTPAGHANGASKYRQYVWPCAINAVYEEYRRNLRRADGDVKREIPPDNTGALEYFEAMAEHYLDKAWGIVDRGEYKGFAFEELPVEEPEADTEEDAIDE